MLKVLMTVAALVAAGSAFAQGGGEESPEDWHEANYVCRMGETREGVEVGAERVDTACVTRDNLGEILLSHGFCWSRSEQEWFVRGEDDGFCEDGSPPN